MNKTILFIALLVVGLLQIIHVQPTMAFQDTVTGQVVDQATDETLPGVNIIIQGTQRGTSTDAQGRYELEVPSLQDTLVFSFIGYQRHVVPINGRTTVNVAMSAQTLAGEELVVVGYGTQRRKQVTGSVTSVSEEDFVSGNVNNASQMIQGKVPGLLISGRGANPNQDETIRLRGVSSFGSNQEPLIVVDGVIGASMDNLDPNDIESIDVLKDASASAIYGTRGSAGVIVVTTKSGTPGDQNLSVSYNGYVTYEGIENKIDVLSADQYREFSRQTGFEIQDFGNNTDWFDEISQMGTNNVHNLAISGGTENLNYRVSGNFRDRQGIQKYTGFQQIGGRLNITQWTLDQKLQFTVNLASTNRESQLGSGDAFRYAALMNPTAPVKADGFENTGGYHEQSLFNYYNPVAIIEESERSGETKFFNGSLRADYEFTDLIPNLSASAFYSIETENEIRRNFWSRRHKQLGGATQAALGPGRAEQFMDDRKSELFETTLNYLADISSELSMEAFVGYSYNEIIQEGFSASGGDFVNDAVMWNSFIFAHDFDQGEGFVNSYKFDHKIIGFFGRANLNYDDTYFVNGSLRQEASSWFGEDNKWGLFWSAGLGVELTNLFEISALDELRLRGSIGKTGNDAPVSGISLERFAPQGNFFANGRFIQSFGPVSNANPDLKWEEKTEINIGVDFALLESRLTGSAEVYNSVTSDLLFEIGVPVPPNPFPTTWQNVGELETSGLDVALNYSAIQGASGRLNWNTGLTFSLFSETMLNKFASEEVRFIASAGSPGQNSTNMIRIKEGEPIGQIWGPKFAGISTEEDGFVDENGDPIIGDWMFFDKDGNKILFGDVSVENEQVLGNGLPDFQLGWTNNINYKKWDFSLFIRGVFGHQLINLNRLFQQAPQQLPSYNVMKTALEIPELKVDPQFSDFQVEDADFIRIQNASLGYTFPLAENSLIRKLRAYVSANNLLTITGYTGIDPEPSLTDENPGETVTGFSLGGPLAPGIERRSNWYTARSINIGINLDF